MTKTELLKTAKPILFNTEMVRAIQDGKKTVTRRVIQPQPKSKLSYIFAGKGAEKWSYPDENAYKSWGNEFKLPPNITDEDLEKHWTAPCHAGDILYVRETWSPVNVKPKRYLYKTHCSEAEKLPVKWHPSIHMPNEAARIFLRVTGVRVERLRDCGNMQAKDEGVTVAAGLCEFGTAPSRNPTSTNTAGTLIRGCGSLSLREWR